MVINDTHMHLYRSHLCRPAGLCVYAFISNVVGRKYYTGLYKLSNPQLLQIGISVNVIEAVNTPKALMINYIKQNLWRNITGTENYK